MTHNQSIITEIKSLIANAKDNAIKAIDKERVLLYWHIGQRIFVEEQLEKNRADYGTYLTQYIAQQLEPEYGSGYSKRQIELFRQFYRVFPIANAVRSQLHWSQYKLLLRIGYKDKIDFYIAEPVNDN